MKIHLNFIFKYKNSEGKVKGANSGTLVDFFDENVLKEELKRKKEALIESGLNIVEGPHFTVATISTTL